ncbi:hypothetical protein FE257_008947 [Aspergillus nanangensis]|uniref:CENP-V/GFA domain-containing protein n=1 Tax=Aspergillus nanangensis TaxID=2582783 RepID=A0AAD4CWU8_ASPNN|nr:hypothetical protein FE257_008947 [Aspergillus nanangensis]
MPVTGGCMCGGIAYLVNTEHYISALCHCIDCQKWAGSALTSNVVVPRTSFQLTKGTPRAYDTVGSSGKVNRHFFCPSCGSSLYTELEVMPGMTCVKAGGLDVVEASLGGKVDIEMFVKDRPSYLAAIEGAKQEQRSG